MDILFERYIPSGEWDIESYDITRRDFYCECCLDPYTEVYFTLHLKRKYLFYVLQIIVPSLMLTVLDMMVFYLPPQSGEKMSMGVTLLLSYAVFLLLIAETIPHTSDGVPCIVIYLLYSMASTCLSVLAEIFVLMVHHNTNISGPPAWLRTLIRRKDVKKSPILVNIKYHSQESVHQMASESATENDGDVCILLRRVLQEIENYKQGKHTETLQRQSEKDWQDVAAAIDAMLFYIMLAVNVIGCTALLIIMPHIGQN